MTERNENTYMSEFNPEREYKHSLIERAFGEYEAMCRSGSVIEACDPLIKRMGIAISKGEITPQMKVDAFITEANVILSYQLRDAFHKIFTEKPKITTYEDGCFATEVARRIFEKHHQLN